MTTEEKIEKHLDEVMQELERESTREMTVTRHGATLRFDLRSVGWSRWSAAGPFAFLALWILGTVVWSALASDGPSRHTLPAVLASAAVAFIALLVICVRESVLINQRELVFSSAIGRLTVTKTRVPIEAIREVRVGSFSFASWDPYVVIATDHRRHRFAWSVSQRAAQKIAQAIRDALPIAADSPLRPAPTRAT